MRYDLRQSALLILVLAVAGLGIALVSNVILYHAALDQQGLRLAGMAQSYARLVEAIAAHETHWAHEVTMPAGHGSAEQGLLSQLRVAEQGFRGFGRTGELNVARREGDSIVFLLAHRGSRTTQPSPVPFRPDIAQPIYRALHGQSGAGVLADYRGARVLAAYEPVSVFGLAVVAKLDLAEVQAPFIRAGLWSVAATLLFVVGGGLLVLLITKPARRRLRQAEDALATNYDLLRAAVESMPGPFFSLDREYRYTSFNSAHAVVMKALYGAVIELGRSMLEYQTGLTDRAVARANLDRALAGETFAASAYSGDEGRFRRFFEVVHSPTLGRDGGVEGVAVLALDVTDRRQAEAELARHRDHLEEMVRLRTLELEASNRELEAFSYSVSHDLRAPLRAIDGFTQALVEDAGPQLDTVALGHLDRVRGAAQRMAELIDDLLNLARIARLPLEPRPVNLSEIAGKVAEDLRAADPARKVDMVIQAGVAARADAVLAAMVLRNLIGNAWKFTSRHSSAHIEFGETRIDGERVLFVRDDGAGFDMTYVDKLFAPFQRLHAHSEFAGTGIGLATVQRIVRRHGGRAWIEGAIEKGATCYFTFGAEPDRGRAMTND